MDSILLLKINVKNAIKHVRLALEALLIIVHHAKLMACYQKIYVITVPPHNIFHLNHKAARIVIQIARHATKGIIINVEAVTVTDIYKMDNVKAANRISI